MRERSGCDSVSPSLRTRRHDSAPSEVALICHLLQVHIAYGGEPLDLSARERDSL